MDKIYVVYGGFYPRSRMVFGCGGGVRRGEKASADDTSANQRDGATFHVLKIFGGCRRKRSPINNFAYFLRASASPREISSAAGDCREPAHPCAWAVQSVTTFASRTPLPPSISLRSLRSLRLKLLCGLRGLCVRILPGAYAPRLANRLSFLCVRILYSFASFRISARVFITFRPSSRPVTGVRIALPHRE